MTDSKNVPGLAPFDAGACLTDDATIAEFLKGALEDGRPDVFLQAIRTAARARGMAQLARNSGLGRESLQDAAPDRAHPCHGSAARFTYRVKSARCASVEVRATMRNRLHRFIR